MIILDVAIIFFIVDFLNFIKRHKRIQQFAKQIDQIPEGFYENAHLIEQDYLDIISNLSYEMQSQLSNSTAAYSDMMEYYTVWAHQIKTPISAISLTVQNIEDDELRANLQAELLRIEEYADMVLNYLRLDSESNDFVFEKVSLDDIVKSEIKRFMPLFMNKKISVDYKPIEDIVITDKKWIGFCVGQLLSNSLKYSKMGTQIHIFSDKKGEIVVRDEGIGISSEDCPRVFERGYTGYNGRREKKSTGIGLYLVKRTVDKLGCDVSLSSEVGQGTTVRIQINENKSIIE